MTNLEARDLVVHMDMMYRMANGSVNLLEMSKRTADMHLTLNFRRYVEASRILRAEKKGAAA